MTNDKLVFLPSDLEKLLMEGRYQKEVKLMDSRVKVRLTYMQKKEEDDLLVKVTEEMRNKNINKIPDMNEINSEYMRKLDAERIKIYLKDEIGQYRYKENGDLPAFIYDTCFSMYEMIKSRSVSYLFGNYDFDKVEESVKEDTGKHSSTEDSISS